MELREHLKILDLSVKEERVLLALQARSNTVQDIATHAKVTRPSVYDILKKLKKRGLVTSTILHGKKSWHMVPENELIDTLYSLKKKLLGFVDGKEELTSATDGVVTVHRGEVAIKKVIFEMIRHRKHERFLCYTAFSDILDKGWLAIFSEDEIGEFNRIVKKNGIISELIAPFGWIEDHYKAMGDTWAKDYEGRASSAVCLDKKYFEHSGQIFAFKDVMYLLALKDKMIIEIRHSDIQKMILAMCTFMKERGEAVDVNKRLRELMEKDHEKEAEGVGDVKMGD